MLKRSLFPAAGNANSLRGYKVADENKDEPEMGASTGKKTLSDREMKFALWEE